MMLPENRAVRRAGAAVAEPVATPPDGGDPDALLEVAERHRRKQDAEGKPATARRNRAAAEAKPEAADADEAARPRRKLVAARRRAISTDTLGPDEESDQARAAKPKAAKPRRVAATGPVSLWARLGAWGVAAAAAALAVAVLTLDALHEVPRAMPVSAVRIAWLPGPRLPDPEVLAWLNLCPVREKLAEPNPWVLDQLAAWLRAQPAVAAVDRVRVVHEAHQAATPGKAPRQAMRRTLELTLGLRQPVMPAVLASGESAWVDIEGRVLPGHLPGPGVKRPKLRAIEQARPGAVLAALAMWSRLEPELETGLVSDIVLNDPLDERGARGIVLYTRHGSRLIWGDHEEERYGVRAEAKARDLVRTLRAQGDLTRVATINVRFNQPFFTFRE